MPTPVNITLTNNPQYRESVAYHEAGHVVVATVQGLQLSRYGIRLRDDGTGISYYKFRKPKRFYDGPSEISREHTLIALYAGLISQQVFYPDCSTQGANDDQNLIDLLLQDMDAQDTFPSLALASLVAQIELKKESQKLVDKHWPAIVALATALWETPDKPRDFDEPEPDSPQSQFEKMLGGRRVAEILQPFGITVSIWDLPPD